MDKAIDNLSWVRTAEIILDEVFPHYHVVSEIIYQGDKKEPCLKTLCGHIINIKEDDYAVPIVGIPEESKCEKCHKIAEERGYYTYILPPEDNGPR